MRTKFDDAQELGPDIDTKVSCACGTSFWMYLPGIPHQCPKCGTLYEATIIIELITEDERLDNFVLVGREAVDGE